MTLPVTTVEYDGKSERDRLAEGEAILSAYSNGTPVSQLIEDFGLSKATINRRITQAINARLAVTVDQYRETQNALLDEQMVMIGEQIDAARQLLALGAEQKDAAVIERGMNQRLRAIEARTRIMERRAKLNGLDAPVKAEVTVVVETEQDRELAELVRESKAKAANREPEPAPR